MADNELYVNVYLVNGKERTGGIHFSLKEAEESKRFSLLKRFYVRTEKLEKQSITK